MFNMLAIINKKDEVARNKVSLSGSLSLRTVSAEFVCLPLLHRGPGE